ncbi:mannosyltransferase putative-domain-containing protein [Circinella umbellata]|nr:mannosyltransferase putative-domain-containing protein [Circinella umbellata]
MVAGNRDTFERALTSVKVLRRQDCHLPVEIWHLPDELPSDATLEALNELGAVPRDLSEPSLPRPMQYRRDTEKQFQIKAAAIINANFEQVLYLDSDNTPTRNPSFLFETSAFKATGAMFWPDFWKTHTENKIFEVLDISCKDEWEQESGQMVIDKTKSWLPLQLAWYMQEHSDIYFQFLNGDKDTFKYAWKALGVPYYMTETFLGMEASNDDNQQQSFHERPWRQIKRYVNSKGVTNLSPGFRVAPGGKACMNFINEAWNEPETVIEEFDEILPGFQNTYFELGGIGGEAR